MPTQEVINKVKSLAREREDSLKRTLATLKNDYENAVHRANSAARERLREEVAFVTKEPTVLYSSYEPLKTIWLDVHVWNPEVCTLENFYRVHF